MHEASDDPALPKESAMYSYSMCLVWGITVLGITSQGPAGYNQNGFELFC